YGVRAPLSQIRELACTDTTGTNLLGMTKAAAYYGFQSKSVRIPLSELAEVPVPSLIHTLTDNGLPHYQVLLRVTHDEVLLGDPDGGIVRMSLIEWSERWTGVLLLLSPGMEIRTDGHKQGRL